MLLLLSSEVKSEAGSRVGTGVNTVLAQAGHAAHYAVHRLRRTEAGAGELDVTGANTQGGRLSLLLTWP